MKVEVLSIKKLTKKDFPKKVTIDGKHYFILKNNNQYFLGSTLCPHMGGSIEFDNQKKEFLCPIHNWKFNQHSGECLNSSQNMSLINLELLNHTLWVDQNKIKNHEKIIKNKTLTSEKIKKPIKIKLISHATLDISLEKLKILIDPWIDGPAMLGAWRQYPLTGIKAKDIKPYCIIITHEHSDHFHIPTLVKFNKKTPIIIPDFPNQRIQKFLTKLGFKNIKVVKFEEEINLHTKVKIKFFKPVSVFNDSISLIDIDGYKILNLNDAGLNPNIAQQVKPVDVISCIFSTGASGYPYTWQHLSENEKNEIMERACEGKIKLLMQATELYDSNYILPFASHFKLWQPEHEDYLRSITTNSIDDILNEFKEHKMEHKLIDMIPGDTWDTESNHITRQFDDRYKIYDPKNIIKNVKNDFNINGKNLSLTDFWNTTKKKISIQEAKNYFTYLNDSPDIKNCEDINVELKCWYKNWEEIKFQFKFQISNGKLNHCQESYDCNNTTQYKIDITEDILATIICGDISWDEARVGYWIKWWRNTSKVKTGFLRLLQGPYKMKKTEKTLIKKGMLNENMSISSLIEIYGKDAELIFEKYGMFCSGCDLSPWEDIISGAKKHGLNDIKITELLNEFELMRK